MGFWVMGSVGGTLEEAGHGQKMYWCPEDPDNAFFVKEVHHILV